MGVVVGVGVAGVVVVVVAGAVAGAADGVHLLYACRIHWYYCGCTCECNTDDTHLQRHI